VYRSGWVLLGFKLVIAHFLMIEIVFPKEISKGKYITNLNVQ